MAASFSKGIGTAIKRARSQDSLRSSETPHSAKADEAEEPPDDFGIPAYLRQSRAEINSKFKELNWQEQIRLAQGRADPESKWVQDTSSPVLDRNRYFGVQPWDKHRIRLKVGEGMSDYINASPILLKDHDTGIETKYIATQGPKRSSMSHFWQMVWQETKDVAVIVMLTPTEESGRPKCFQYFPLDAESGPVIVKASGHADNPEAGEVSFVELLDHYGPKTQVRKLHLTFGSETKIVWHLFFMAIADFGVPEVEDRPEILDLIKLSAEKNTKRENPRIIHCSAGVGRSGTFIALEYLISQLGTDQIAKAKPGEDPIYDVVQQLREQRMMMVQSELQYQFLYEVLADQLEKYQAVKRNSGQPSPKLRKLTGGMKATMLDETYYLNESSNSEIKINYSEPGPLGVANENAHMAVAPSLVPFQEAVDSDQDDAEESEPVKEDGINEQRPAKEQEQEAERHVEES